MLRKLAHFTFSGGYNTSYPIGEEPHNIMVYPSTDWLVTGSGQLELFMGTTPRPGELSSQVMMNVGSTYAGLGDHSETGIGSVFQVLGSIFFIGAGKLYYGGVYQSASASTTLSLKKITAGVLGTTYQAGLAQPSAPTITAVAPPTGKTGKNNGVVSVRIARVRSATGARSIASLSSNVIQCVNQSVAITFPSTDSNGQDYWEIDVTKNGEGALGNHFFLEEIPESLISGTVTVNATTDADTTIGVPNDTLTSEHIGWQYTSSGDTTTYVTAVGADDSHSAGLQTITLNAASVLSTTQSATFTRGISGTTRTYVVEWKDADIIGSDFAPIRDYPPPAAVFAGTAEDVVFVDGAYGDTVNLVDRTANTTTTTIGNAIAVSDPARPESFPPDNYIFTGDSPTCLLPGGGGVTWRFGRNSLGVIRYIGGSPSVSYEKVWNGIGVRSQHNACLGAGGRLYAYTGQKGAIRLGVNGEPDTAFAIPVAWDMRNWAVEDVVLGYDANYQYIVFTYGDEMFCYHEPTGRWSALLTLTGDAGDPHVCSVATVDGAIYIGHQTGSTMTVRNFNVQDAFNRHAGVVTPWVVSEGETDIVSRIRVGLKNDNSSASLNVFRNGNQSSSLGNATITSNSRFKIVTTKPNVRGCRMWQVGLSVNRDNGNKHVDFITVEGETSGIVV